MLHHDVTIIIFAEDNLTICQDKACRGRSHLSLLLAITRHAGLTACSLSFTNHPIYLTRGGSIGWSPCGIRRPVIMLPLCTIPRSFRIRSWLLSFHELSVSSFSLSLPQAPFA